MLAGGPSIAPSVEADDPQRRLPQRLPVLEEYRILLRCHVHSLLREAGYGEHARSHGQVVERPGLPAFVDQTSHDAGVHGSGDEFAFPDVDGPRPPVQRGDVHLVVPVPVASVLRGYVRTAEGAPQLLPADVLEDERRMPVDEVLLQVRHGLVVLPSEDIVVERMDEPEPERQEMVGDPVQAVLPLAVRRHRDVPLHGAYVHEPLEIGCHGPAVGMRSVRYVRQLAGALCHRAQVRVVAADVPELAAEQVRGLAGEGGIPAGVSAIPRTPSVSCPGASGSCSAGCRP